MFGGYLWHLGVLAPIPLPCPRPWYLDTLGIGKAARELKYRHVLCNVCIRKVFVTFYVLTFMLFLRECFFTRYVAKTASDNLPTG